MTEDEIIDEVQDTNLHDDDEKNNCTEENVSAHQVKSAVNNIRSFF